MTAKEFDLIVWGATGYTGRLVAEHLAARAYPDLRWAMAGRSAEKLHAVAAEIGAPKGLPVVVADAGDPAALAGRTRVILTTVGPYQLYGAPLVEACAKAGTDYLDLCGEPAWMRKMIDRHEAAAKTSGARILFSSGFDSIPFDLGVWFLQDEARRRLGAPCVEVKARVRKMRGKFSGGTAASLKATMAAAFQDPSVIELLKSPFALTPDFTGAPQPSGSKPQEEDGVWLAPFIMAPINTKNVHRTNFLTGFSYGKDFRYSEMMVAGPGPAGEAAAKAIASDTSLMGEDAPKPGEGPTKEERDSGYYDVLFAGATADGRTLRASVIGDKDPGYGSTSKIIAETAICLLTSGAKAAPGMITPAAALGRRLVDRLAAHAGVTFAIES